MSYQIGCPCPCSYLCRQCQRPQSCTGCTWCSVPSAPEPVTIGATEGSLHSPDFAVTALIEEKFDPDVQTFYSHQCFDVQGHRSHVDADRSPNHYPTCNISDSIAQTYSDYFALHPVLGMIAHLGQDGTVVKVYGPPLDLNTRPYFPQFSLWQENSRVTVPQPPYKSGTPRKDWTQKASLLFFMRKSLGVRLSDALYGKIGGIDHQGGSTLENCNAISIRIHLPGYYSSTQVEKILKARCESIGGEKARSMRVSTKIDGRPVTTSKLAKEVSKRIQWHISDLEDNKNLFPFDPRVGNQWRLGQGRMKPEYMVVIGLSNVSSGSWSPVIELDTD